MNKQERKKAEELEKKCRCCPNYQEYKDKHWIKDGFCIAFKMVYTHVNDYTKCPYDKEDNNEQKGNSN